MSSAQDIYRWYEQLKNERFNFDNTAQAIIDNIDPHHRDVTIERAAGARKNERMFDGTGGYGSHIFSQFVQGALFNQATQWFSLRSRDPQVNQKQDNAAWMKDTTARILLQMRPSFYGPAGQNVLDWGLFGNGPMLIEEVPRGPRAGLGRLKFTAIPWGQYVMAEGDDGKIDKFIRSMKLPAHQVVKLGKVSDSIERAAEKEPMKQFEILHSIMPRDFSGYSKSKVSTNKDYPFASCWVEVEAKRLIKESGYRKFPVAVARYSLIAGETYARGLGELCLPDQKSLHRADESALLKWDRELDPPLLQKRGSIIGNILSTQARGRTVVTDINNSVKALFENSNWQAHDMMADRKQKQILQVWHVNEILNLMSREKPEMTAFEVSARLQLLQQIIGPIFGLLEAEFLSVIVDICLDLMANIPGMIAKPPADIAQSIPHNAFDIVYEGPLARAQRNQEIQAIQQTVADIGGIQPFEPSIPKLLDWEKTARRLSEIRGTQDLLVSNEEYIDAMNKMLEQQNAEKQAAMIGGAAQAAGQAAPFLKVMRDQASGGQSAAA
jgi:hypothetical protein